MRAGSARRYWPFGLNSDHLAGVISTFLDPRSTAFITRTSDAERSSHCNHSTSSPLRKGGSSIMRHFKKLALLAVAMLIAVACARYGIQPILRNFTW
jgi:hypothetical protein